MTSRSRATRLAWWLTDLLSMSLEEREREVVRGDLIECRAHAGQALGEMLVIVLRRQAALWLEWRPWLALVAIVLPVGLLLSHATRWWGVATAIDVMRYWTLWDFAYLGYPGWRADLLRVVLASTVAFVALIGWSWTSGFVMSRVSRRTMWVTLTLLGTAVFLGTAGTVSTAERHTMIPSSQDHAIAIAPALLRTLLVMLPALFGAHRGRKGLALPLVQTIIAALLLASVTVLVSRGLEGSVVFGRGMIPADPGPDGYVVSPDDPRPLWPLSLVMMWPAVYIVITTSVQRWRNKPALA